MATTNKNKLAALNKENCEEYPRSNLAQNSNVPRSQEDYITQVSEEIEGRVTKKLSQEFNRTENRILGALARPDDFLTNPLIQGHSGTAPETSRNVFSISQRMNEDDSQSNPHPEVGLFNNQMTQNSDLDDRHDMATELQRERERERERESLRTRHGDRSSRRSHLLLPLYIFRKSEKEQLHKSTAIPQWKHHFDDWGRQILLALQQLANNNNSANFYNNIIRISKLPKSLTTTMPTFDGKPEKFELFEDLFRTSPKLHNQLTEEDRINYFHSLMRGDALQTFKNIIGPIRENLGEILAVFRRKYVKPQSMATAKHKFQKLVLNPANQKLVDFLDELQKRAKNAFGIAAHVINEQFI